MSQLSSLKGSSILFSHFQWEAEVVNPIFTTFILSNLEVFLARLASVQQETWHTCSGEYRVSDGCFCSGSLSNNFVLIFPKKCIGARFDVLTTVLVKI